MQNQDEKLYCLALRVHRFHGGEIDGEEVRTFLNREIGQTNWLMAARWMFARPPLILRPGFWSAPVLCPGDAAHHLIQMADDGHRPQRVVGDHVVDDVELAGWRQIAAQTDPQNPQGLFPWELRQNRKALVDA